MLPPSVPWLRICGEATTRNRIRQQAVILLHFRMVGDIGQRGHGADLKTVAIDANAAQLVDAAQVDQHIRLLDAVLQPVEAVQTAGHHPGPFADIGKQTLRIRSRGRLKQIEGGHYVANYCHGYVLL